MITKGSEHSEMKVWITPLGKPTRPAKMMAVDEYLKWMMEDREDEY